ncbi:MAG: hypothetical protein V4819_01465 [Verrucomicrobiota bacterium]
METPDLRLLVTTRLKSGPTVGQLEALGVGDAVTIYHKTGRGRNMSLEPVKVCISAMPDGEFIGVSSEGVAVGFAAENIFLISKKEGSKP